MRYINLHYLSIYVCLSVYLYTDSNYDHIVSFPNYQLLRQDRRVCLPGQSSRLQAAFCRSDPRQSRPPCDGAGESQDRRRDRSPPPHDAPHVDHSLHVPQPPSTTSHSIHIHQPCSAFCCHRTELGGFLF